jgi:hypothetical protein
VAPLPKIGVAELHPIAEKKKKKKKKKKYEKRTLLDRFWPLGVAAGWLGHPQRSRGGSATPLFFFSFFQFFLFN